MKNAQNHEASKHIASSSRWLIVAVGAVAACAFAAAAQYYLALWEIHDRPEVTPEVSHLKFDHTGQSEPCIALATALPESVYSAQHPTYNASALSYWSINACESRPTCIVRPADTQAVATTVEILKRQFMFSKDSAAPLRFAVRSGGHSPEAGFSSIDGGIVVDLSLLNEVLVSTDRQSTLVGVGAQWRDVSSKLDSMGLAIVGGRNAHVGVGGLVLGGGISFFSPRYGMVCDNIDEYEVVLANGTVAHVTSSRHADLWRALKGGTGNFGIVTRVKAKTFAATDIWSGYAYWTGWQSLTALKAFAEFNRPENFDEYAAGPLLALAYIQNLGISIAVTNLAYTKPVPWAPVFDPFKKIWRLWNTFKVQSLTDATHELHTLAPLGQRQFQATMTVQNDLDTLVAIRDIYSAKLKEVKGVRGSIWSLVYQPLSAAVTRKGSPNVLGLESRRADETLIIILISVSWLDANDDELVHRASRDIIAAGEGYARSKGTADPYIYLNYAASGQDPFAGYGEASRNFLQAVSRTYDPDRFFQRAKQGGFKLDIE